MLKNKEELINLIEDYRHIRSEQERINLEVSEKKTKITNNMIDLLSDNDLTDAELREKLLNLGIKIRGAESTVSKPIARDRIMKENKEKIEEIDSLLSDIGLSANYTLKAFKFAKEEDKITRDLTLIITNKKESK